MYLIFLIENELEEYVYNKLKCLCTFFIFGFHLYGWTNWIIWKKNKELRTRTNSFLHQCAGIEAHPLTQGFHKPCSWLGCQRKPINSTHVMRFSLTHICYEVCTLEFSVKAIWLHLPETIPSHIYCIYLVHNWFTE